MKKLIIYALIAYAVYYFFLKDKMKAACCSSCAAGGACEGTTEALPEDVQTGTEKGFFYDTTKSKWVKVR